MVRGEHALNLGDTICSLLDLSLEIPVITFYQLDVFYEGCLVWLQA